MRILAHRGASVTCVENTIEAFTEAVAQGADGVELDVMRCASGELVVIHDERLDRLAGVPLDVRRSSWRALRSVEVGASLGKRPARIPLLDDVFDVLPAAVTVNVELKCDGPDDGGLTDGVARLLDERRLGDRVFVSSFNSLCLVRLARVAPRLRRGLLLDPKRRFWPQELLLRPLTSSYSVHPHHSHCDASRIAAWHAAGLAVAVWTVDDPARALALRELGVEWLITNEPARLRQTLGGSTGEARC